VLEDIAEQTAINKSTAYRFLAHLETERYLYATNYGAYMIGPKLVRLGSGISYQTNASQNKPSAAAPVVEDNE